MRIVHILLAAFAVALSVFVRSGALAYFEGATNGTVARFSWGAALCLIWFGVVTPIWRQALVRRPEQRLGSRMWEWILVIATFFGWLVPIPTADSDAAFRAGFTRWVTNNVDADAILDWLDQSTVTGAATPPPRYWPTTQSTFPPPAQGIPVNPAIWPKEIRKLSPDDVRVLSGTLVMSWRGSFNGWARFLVLHADVSAGLPTEMDVHYVDWFPADDRTLVGIRSLVK